MAETYEEIMRTALTLSPGFPAMLAEHLLESLVDVGNDLLLVLSAAGRWRRQCEDRVVALSARFQVSHRR